MKIIHKWLVSKPTFYLCHPSMIQRPGWEVSRFSLNQRFRMIPIPLLVSSHPLEDASARPLQDLAAPPSPAMHQLPLSPAQVSNIVRGICFIYWLNLYGVIVLLAQHPHSPPPDGRTSTTRIMVTLIVASMEWRPGTEGPWHVVLAEGELHTKLHNQNIAS